MLAELAALRREVADLRALIGRLVAAGEVTAQDPATGRVKVRLPGHDNVTTAWLPVLSGRAKGTRCYSMPAIGEQVWCQFLPSGGCETGAVIGSSYNDQDATPAASADIYRLEWADGASLAHDAQAGSLALESKGTLVATAAEALTLTSAATLEMQATGSLGIKGVTITLTAPSVTIQAASVTISGALAVGSLSVGGKAFDTHAHHGVLSGLDDTLGVV